LNLAEKYDEIHGLDLNASVDEVAAVFVKRNIKTYLQNGNILDMPYQDNYFDTVLLISIREHHFYTEKDVLAAAENALDTSVLSSYNVGFVQEKSLSLAGLPERSYRERQSYSNNTLQKRRKES
jgi:hypothetical protein